MNIQSNIPIPEIQVWKEGQYLVAFNHKDNGLQPDGDEGKRYEAEFTIVNSLDEAEILRATHRHFHDTELEQNVIFNIETEGGNAIDIVKEYDPSLPKIKSVDIVHDSELVKTPEVITSTVLPVDQVIQKLSGKVENYIIDLSEGARTPATNAEINALIADKNIIITQQ